MSAETSGVLHVRNASLLRGEGRISSSNWVFNANLTTRQDDEHRCFAVVAPLQRCFHPPGNGSDVCCFWRNAHRVIYWPVLCARSAVRKGAPGVLKCMFVCARARPKFRGEPSGPVPMRFRRSTTDVYAMPRQEVFLG